MPIPAVIVIGIISFILGIIALFAFAHFVLFKPNGLKVTKRKKEQPSKKKEGLFSRIGVMNFILIVVFGSLLTFTIVIIGLFKEYGTIPDTLVTCVFACLGGECGAMAWIKTAKERNKERKWEIDDRKHYENAAQTTDEQEENYGT